MITRISSVVDNRHAIRDPFGPGHNDMEIWTNTLLKERVSTLFLTQVGLRGHAVQIENELNRLANIEGRCGVVVEKAVRTAKFIRAAIKEAQKEANHLGYSWQCHN